MADTSSMENDAAYQYLKLVMENAWIIFALGLVWWLLRNPDFIKSLTNLEIGPFKIQRQIAELEAKVEAAQVQIERVQSRNAELSAVFEQFDADAPLDKLKEVKANLKRIARNADERDLQDVTEGLQPNASPEQLMAAAVVLRARRDVDYFDEVVTTLGRLARDSNLGGIRLNTVWTLISALHLMLVDEFQNAPKPRLTVPQLNAARDMLQVLVENPRVLADRPDAPLKGIRGPAKNAMTQISKGLKRLGGD